MGNLLLLLILWFGAICTTIVVVQIGKNAIEWAFKWYQERKRWRLPKPPDNYRLN